MTRSLFIGAAGILCVFSATAQRVDSTRTQSIDITSSFKPVLRNAVKINFSGSPLTADTSRPSLTYNIPSQNLFYAYQPISLRPLAITQDTNLYLGNRNFLKAGFGSLNTPYFATGLSFGDGKTSLLNLYGNYIASKSDKIEHQDYSMLNIKGTGSYFGPKNEVYAAADISMDNYYLYGYDHSLYKFDKKDIRQQFQDITVSGGVRNTVKNELDVSYNPNVQLSFFTNKGKLSETSFMVDVPVEKRFSEELVLKVSAKGDFTNYTTKDLLPANIKLSNNVLQVNPSFEYVTEFVKLHGGAIPTWNDGKFILLPDAYAELKFPEQSFTIQAGYVGRYIKNTYKYLSAINPYLATISAQNNTKEIEYYGGIKTSVAKHFNLSAKAGLITYNDLPIFINDTSADEKAFLVSNETKAKNFRIHGDISYVSQEKFTLTAGLTLNAYTGLKVNAKAWHTIPMEFNGALRWWALDRLLIKGDLYFFNGGKYLEKGFKSGSLTGGTDLSAGAEFKINKQFGAWLNLNNLLNDKYERWHNYPVYGTNITAGILINF